VKLNSRTTLGQIGRLEVRVSDEGKFQAFDPNVPGVVVAEADTYKALQAEAKKAVREAARDEFGEAEVLILVDGRYGNDPDELLGPAKLVGLTPGLRMIVKLGGKRRTFDDSVYVYSADGPHVAELRAAVGRVNLLKTQLAAAEALLGELREQGAEVGRSYRDETRAEVVARIKEVLA
jgi:hypothetical protein